MAERGGVCFTINLFSAVLGAIACFSAFPVFFFHFGNHQAGIWAFGAGIFACLTLVLHLLYYRHSLELWYTPQHLTQIRNLGVLGMLGGVAGCATYLGIALTNHEALPSMDNIASSHFFPAIWSMMTLKWSGSVAYFAHKYRRLLLQEYHPLLS